MSVLIPLTPTIINFPPRRLTQLDLKASEILICLSRGGAAKAERAARGSTDRSAPRTTP